MRLKRTYSWRDQFAVCKRNTYKPTTRNRPVFHTFPLTKPPAPSPFYWRTYWMLLQVLKNWLNPAPYSYKIYFICNPPFTHLFSGGGKLEYSGCKNTEVKKARATTRISIYGFYGVPCQNSVSWRTTKCRCQIAEFLLRKFQNKFKASNKVLNWAEYIITRN